MKLRLGTCCALVAAIGCGGPNDPFGDPFLGPAISSQRLAGTISGQRWTFRTGDAALARGSEAMQYAANLYADTRKPCESFGVQVDRPVIALVVPTSPGGYEVGGDVSVTFNTTGFDNVATEGWLAIDSITATTISGGLKALQSGREGINGRFDAVICP